VPAQGLEANKHPPLTTAPESARRCFNGVRRRYWSRAPHGSRPKYNVVFQTLDGGHASGQCEIFADGFARPVKSPAQAEYRPTGLAVAPDGSLYVSDDVRGRIYRIDYRGGADFNAASVTPCPSAAAPAGNPADESAQPPEGSHPDAGAAAANSSLPLPEGATREMVLLGERVNRGQVAGAACTGCHGDSGQGIFLGSQPTR
jgi:hypothetical protein